MSSPDLGTRLQALTTALEAGRGRLADDVLTRADDVVKQAGARMALAPEHTIVALAGATGSGKSSLLNALVGQEVALPGVTRPTTSRPVAAVWGDPERNTDAALDWLDVSQRHHVAGEALNISAGLVVLDLPDHDSVERSHRKIAERLVDRVDLLVWVLDPQKYADHAIHDQFLKPLAAHAAVMVLVLNQIDRLSSDEAEACKQDLARLAADDGLDQIRLIGASARTGAGVDELRTLLVQAATKRAAAVDRLTLRVQDAAAPIVAACGSGAAQDDPEVAKQLDRALHDVAGVDQVVAASRVRTLQRARAATGWPVTRWLGKFRIDPLRRLNLHQGVESAELVHSSRPQPGPDQDARVHIALREYGRSVTADVPAEWALAAQDRIDEAAPLLAAQLDQAVAHTDLEANRRPTWWRALNAWQWGLFAVLMAGMLWLAALAGMSYFKLPQPDTPQWKSIPWPTLLVMAGAGLGIVTSLAASLFNRLSARRSGRRIRRRLEQSIEATAQRLLRGPVREELGALVQCRDAALIAASPIATARERRPGKKVRKAGNSRSN